VLRVTLSPSNLEKTVSWFSGSYHDPKANPDEAAALTADLGEYYWQQQDHAARGNKIVNLTDVCRAFARAELTMAATFDVLVRFSLRRRHLDVSFTEDYAYGWFLLHWYGSCLAEQGGFPVRQLTPLLGAQSAYGAFRSHFPTTFETFMRRFTTPDAETSPYGVDDACVWKYREVVPSFVHGFVWHHVLRRRAAGESFAGATRGVCDEKYLVKTLVDECEHALGHAAFYWGLADLGLLDVSSLTVPLAGAFFGSPHGDGIVRRANELLATSGSLLQGAASSAGVEHAKALYLDYDDQNDRSFWHAFLLGAVNPTWPARLPPIAAPCDYDDHQLSSSFTEP